MHGTISARERGQDLSFPPLSRADPGGDYGGDCDGIAVPEDRRWKPSIWGSVETSRGVPHACLNLLQLILHTSPFIPWTAHAPETALAD